MTITDKLEYVITKPLFFILKMLLLKYNPKLFFQDDQGIISKRSYTDNFFFMFKNGQSCDAADMMKSLDTKIPNGEVGIDVGANIGITSIWLARKHKTVYSFEPQSDNFLRLLENIEANRMGNIKPQKMALSDKSGYAKFYITEQYGQHSLGKVSTSRIVDTIKVKTLTLDAFCIKNKIKKINVLKIDVEGFELEVLKGANKLIKNKNIGLIIFEISKIPSESLNKDPNDILKFLSKYNYRVMDLKGETVENINLKRLTHQDFYAKPEK